MYNADSAGVGKETLEVMGADAAPAGGYSPPFPAKAGKWPTPGIDPEWTNGVETDRVRLGWLGYELGLGTCPNEGAGWYGLSEGPPYPGAKDVESETLRTIYA